MKGKTQCVDFLTSPGGTDKSRVIDGVQDYLKAWANSQMLSLTREQSPQLLLQELLLLTSKEKQRPQLVRLRRTQKLLTKEQDYKTV